MKKVTIALFLFVSLVSLNAQTLLLEENFPTSGYIFNNGWTKHSGTTDSIVVDGTSLTMPGYYSNSGFAATVKGISLDYNKPFTTPITGDGSVVYFSFLFKITEDVVYSGGYPLHIGVRDNDSAFTRFAARVFFKTLGGGKFNVGVSNTSTASYSSTGFDVNTTYLAVCKYKINTGGNDSTWIWVKTNVPASELEAGAPEVTNFVTAGVDTLNAFAIRQASSVPDFVIDGIRVSQTWSDVALPVELTSFSSSVNGSTVSLSWITASELNNKGFEVERKAEGADFTTVGFVSGKGTTTEITDYSFVDNVSAGSYTYRLRQVDFDGSFAYSNEINVDVTTATSFELGQNYPNPFNPSTSISFSLAKESQVNLSVYNLLGEKVATLVNIVLAAGSHTVDFTATNLTSGMYLYKIEAGEFVSVKKMSLLK